MASCRCLLPTLSMTLLLGFSSYGCANDSAVGRHPQQTRSFESSAHAGVTPFVASDVVIVLDRSVLGLLASGIDVDKDGVVGRNKRAVKEMAVTPMPEWSWTTDAGDTAETLQLEVARALVPRLAQLGNRVGLVAVTERSRTGGSSVVRLAEKLGVVVPVGPADAVRAALADFPPIRERRRTDLAKLLTLAAELLDHAPSLGSRRPRAILLLSFGEPSAPDGIHFATKRAVELAADLGRRGIAVHAIPCRTELAYLHELARANGGSVVPLDQLDTFFAVPAVPAVPAAPGASPEQDR